MLNLNELGQMNGSAGGAAGGEDEELPAPHELGEELKFTGRYERGLSPLSFCFFRRTKDVMSTNQSICSIQQVAALHLKAN